MNSLLSAQKKKGGGGRVHFKTKARTSHVNWQFINWAWNPQSIKFTGRCTPALIHALSLGISIAGAETQTNVCVVMGLDELLDKQSLLFAVMSSLWRKKSGSVWEGNLTLAVSQSPPGQIMGLLVRAVPIKWVNYVHRQGNTCTPSLYAVHSYKHQHLSARGLGFTDNIFSARGFNQPRAQQGSCRNLNKLSSPYTHIPLTAWVAQPLGQHWE